MIRSDSEHCYAPEELLDEKTFIVLFAYEQPVPRQLQEEAAKKKNKEVSSPLLLVRNTEKQEMVEN